MAQNKGAELQRDLVFKAAIFIFGWQFFCT